MKGMALSVNTIVILVIAVIAIVSVSAFFLMSSGGAVSDTDAYRVFSNGCNQYCKPTVYETFKALNSASKNYPAFAQACVKLGYVMSNEPNLEARCLLKCSGCSLDVNENDLQQNLANIVMISGG